MHTIPLAVFPVRQWAWREVGWAVNASARANRLRLPFCFSTKQQASIQFIRLKFQQFNIRAAGFLDRANQKHPSPSVASRSVQRIAASNHQGTGITRRDPFPHSDMDSAVVS
ncbi:hypothetical protein [Duganella sp. S19_KUP01_CR8]|uniref:hypothetical protein n=1 Tax=Duganella sp. S19_KUP01_CR8 TaxID=3025502 RepID=UPI002FCDC17B